MNKDRLREVVVAILLIFFSLISFRQFGFLGEKLHIIFRFFVGQGALFIEMLLFLWGVLSLFKIETNIQKARRGPLALWLLFLAFLLILSLWSSYDGTGSSVLSQWKRDALNQVPNLEGNAFSGLLGALVYALFTWFFAKKGVFYLIFVLVFIAVLLLIDQEDLQSFESMKRSIKKKQRARKIAREEKKRQRKIEKEKRQKVHLQQKVKKDELRKVEKSPKKKVQFIDHHQAKPVEAKKNETQTVGKSMDQAIAEQAKESDKPKQVQFSKGHLYQLPEKTIFERVPSSQAAHDLNASSAKEKSERLVEVMEEFSLPAELSTIHIGPSVTKFEVIPESSVKVNRIASIQDNLMMELAVKTLRVEAPIPGKRAVGIEVPNIEMIPVRMREILDEIGPINAKDNIPVILGRNLMGEPVVASLNKMPHVLVAGATGSGKSVCMNSMIASMLLTQTPDDLKLLLIDPKKVEFTPFSKVPHLLAPVITEADKAAEALSGIVEKMEERYSVFAETGVRNIEAYNRWVESANNIDEKPKMPWIVVIIDELADLMNVSGKSVESSIQRITQLARAAGIHLVVATQRPSVDVITGVIKANIPSRIAFAVSSSVDSRTILDQAGAEDLLGYGDMLYLPMGELSPVRIQGVYISEEEVEAITQFCAQQAEPKFDQDFVEGIENQMQLEQESPQVAEAFRDELFPEVLEFISIEEKASISLLQRRFSIGYNRAARLVDALEDQGVIGEAQGSRQRTVNMEKLEEIKEKLS